MKKICIRTGCDIVKISRIAALAENHDRAKAVFHENERRTASPENLAGIFSAKEACIKALGLRADQWLDIEVRHAPNDKPLLVLSSDIRSRALVSLDCSISHDGDYAIAFVVALQHE